MNSQSQMLQINFDVLINTYREPAWIIDDQGAVVTLNATAQQYYPEDAPRDKLPGIQTLNQRQTHGESALTMHYHRLSTNPLCHLVLLGDFTKEAVSTDALGARPPTDTREDLLKQFIQLIPNPVFIKDRQHRWVLFNRAFADFLGHSPEEMLGKSDHDFVPAAEADVFWAKDEEVFLTGQLNENEESFTDAQGNTRWLLTRKVALLNDQQEQILLGIITDITPQRLLSEKLNKARLEAEQANQVKSRFLAQMSHELRTPLNAVIGFSQLLKKRIDQPAEVEMNYLERIHGNGLYLLNLINDLLDLSMIEVGQVEIQKEDCHISDLLADLAQLFSVRAEEKGLHFDFKTVPLVLETDPTRLRQIVSNLLQNAAKFTEAGYVSLQLVQQENRFQIIVEDSGSGIPTHLREHVFQEFAQLKDRVELSQGGVGLGLAISKKLSERLGFGLSLEDANPGSRFILTLPQQVL